METTTIQIDVKDWKTLSKLRIKHRYKNMALLIKDVVKILKDFKPEFEEIRK